MMRRSLTKLNELTRMILVGQTEAGSAEEQPARDSRLNATNCRWGGSATCHPILRSAKIIQSFVMPEKTYKKSPAKGGSLLAEGKESLLTKSGFVQFTLNQYIWTIPERYKDDTGNWRQITTLTHRVDIDSDGNKTIQKGDVGPFTKNRTEASSSY